MIRPIIRACAVAALRDKTWAEQRVYDSELTPLANALLGQENAPYIIVYTDTDDRPAIRDRNLYSGVGRALSLTLEVGVASAIQNTNGSVTIKFAQTDEGLELAVDMTCNQAVAAIWGDPSSKWGDIIKDILTPLRFQQRRGGSATSGAVKFAARRMVFMCESIADLPPGVLPPARGPVRRFVDLANSPAGVAGGISKVGDIIAKMLAGQVVAPTWRQAQAYLALSTQAVQYLNPDGTPLPWPGIEEPPLVEDSDEYVPVLTDITLTDAADTD